MFFKEIKMKYTIYFFSLVFVLGGCAVTQIQIEPLNLSNVLVVAQQDKTEDRYNLELAVIDAMRKNNILAKSSLNIVKQGQDPIILASDSIQRKLSNEGINTYMLISVRGYDRNFNATKNIPSLKEELRSGHLFQIWRKSVRSVTFTIIFYRNEIPVHYELMKIRTGKDQEKVLERLSKRIDNRIKNAWK
jgi:hypothetical protein